MNNSQKKMQEYATSFLADGLIETKVAFIEVFKRKCTRLYDKTTVSTKTRYNKDSITISFFSRGILLCEVEVNKQKYQKLK